MITDFVARILISAINRAVLFIFCRWKNTSSIEVSSSLNHLVPLSWFKHYIILYYSWKNTSSIEVSSSLNHLVPLSWFKLIVNSLPVEQPELVELDSGLFNLYR